MIQPYFPLDANWQEGFRRGRADAMWGYASIVAITSPVPNYAQGYKDGQRDAQQSGRAITC